MPKYRLTWTGDGSLDLSQVLDDRGVPIIFTKKGDEAVVNEGSYRHPLVQRCLKSGLQSASLDGVAPQAPAPKPAAPSVPKTVKEPPKEEPPKEPPKEEPKAETKKVETKDVLTSTDKLDVTPSKPTKTEAKNATSDVGEKDEPASSKSKGRGSKGRSK